MRMRALSWLIAGSAVDLIVSSSCVVVFVALMMRAVSDIGLSHNCNVLRLAHYDHLMRQQCDLNKLLHDDIRHLSRGAVACASLC